MFVSRLTTAAMETAEQALRDGAVRAFGKIGETDGVVAYLAEWSPSGDGQRQLILGAYDRSRAATRDEGTPALFVRHVCGASRNGSMCWHVAAMAILLLSAEGLAAPEEGFPVLQVSAPVPKGFGIEDLSHERGLPGDWTLLEPTENQEELLRRVLAETDPVSTESSGTEAPQSPQSALSDEGEERGEAMAEIAIYLSKNGLPDTFIQQVLARRRWDLPQHLRARVPRSGRYFGHRPLKAALAAILLERNVLLLGPAGTGKNVLAESLAWCLGLPQYTLSGNPQLREDRVVGADTFRKDHTGTPVVMWKDGRLATAMRVGGMLVFDEMNMTPPELAGIFAVLDWRKTVETDETVIKADPHFCLVGTGNRGYAGTSEINRAMMDRFVVVELSYEDVDMPAVLRQEAGLRDVGLISELTEVFDTLVKIQAGTEVGEEIVTVRGLIDAALLVDRFGFTVRDALTLCVVNKIQGDEDRNTIRTIIEGRFGS